MEKSANITEIGKALSQFHNSMGKIMKSETNPFFKSKYASLPNILDAIQAPLFESGLVFLQMPDEDKLTTILIHSESGEFFQSSYSMHPTKNDPQGIGSAITYARRYALCAILGLNVDEDDDGNKASEPVKGYKFTKIGECKTVAELETLWNESKDLQSDKVFKNEVAKRKKEL